MIQATTKKHKDLYSENNCYNPLLNKKLNLLYKGGFRIQDNAELFLNRLPGLETPQAFDERKKCVSYIPYLSEFCTQFSATLFSEPLEVKTPADGPDGDTTGTAMPDDFYKEFIMNCDRKGTSIHQFMQDCLNKSLYELCVYVGLDFPKAEDQPTNLLEEEAMGLSQGYAYTIPYENVIDWKKDVMTGKYLWIKIWEECFPDDDPTSPPSHYYQFKFWTLKDGKGAWECWQTEVMPLNKCYTQMTVYTKKESGVVSFPQIPIWDLNIPEGYNVGAQIGPICVEHYQRRSFMVANANKTCVSVGFITLGPEISAPGDSIPADIDVPYTAPDMRKRLESDGWVVGRTTEKWSDKLEIVEAKGESHKFISDELRHLVESMMQTLRQMNMTASANTKSVGRSAASKQVDQHGTSMLLSVYERFIKDFVKDYFTCLAIGRGDVIKWSVEGLSVAEPVLEREKMITEVTTLGLDVLKFPPIFKNKYLFSTAMKLLDGNMSDNEKLELQEDLEADVQSGKWDALDPDEATAAGNKMAVNTAKGSAGDSDPSSPTNAQLPTSGADVDPKTMHDRNVSTAGTATTVMDQLKPDYDKKLLQWIPAAHWIQTDVPLESIDDSNRENWEASKHQAKVDSMADAMKDGWNKPIVLVNEPNGNKMKLIDGHHRFLAAEQNGEKTINAFVAYVGGVDGPWKNMHDLQKQGSAGGKKDQSQQKSNQKS